MSNYLKLYLFGIFGLWAGLGYGQNQRRVEHNELGWYSLFINGKFSEKISAQTDFQWRRDHWLTSWQQWVTGGAFNYQLHPKLQLRVGYSRVESFPYGQTPVNSMGKKFSEHRPYQLLMLTDKLGKVEISHSFILEQRWQGKYSRPELLREDSWVYTNRLRYQIRLQMPLNQPKTLYAYFYSIVSVAFGKNVNANVFNQNRLGLLLGYKLNPHFRLEFGYMNQLILLGRLVQNQQVLQNNHGLHLNLQIGLDFRDKDPAKAP